MADIPYGWGQKYTVEWLYTTAHDTKDTMQGLLERLQRLEQQVEMLEQNKVDRRGPKVKNTDRAQQSAPRGEL